MFVFEFEFDVDAKRPQSSPKKSSGQSTVHCPLSTVHYPVPIPECTEPTTRPTSPTEARRVFRYAGMYVERRRRWMGRYGTRWDWVGRERQMMMRWEVAGMDAARCEDNRKGSGRGNGDCGGPWPMAGIEMLHTRTCPRLFASPSTPLQNASTLSSTSCLISSSSTPGCARCKVRVSGTVNVSGTALVCLSACLSVCCLSVPSLPSLARRRRAHAHD